MRVFLRSIFLLLLITPTCVLPVVGQGTEHWKAFGGANFSRVSDPLGSLHGERTGRSANGVGYQVGIGKELLRNAAWGMRSELSFVTRSTGYYYTAGNVDDTADPVLQGTASGTRSMRTHAIEVPALLIFHRWAGLRVDAGPAASVLITATERWKSEEANGDGTVSVDRTDAIRRIEWAFVLGLEVQGAKRISARMRLWKGLSDLDLGAGSSPSFITSWQIGVCYAFGSSEPTRMPNDP